MTARMYFLDVKGTPAPQGSKRAFANRTTGRVQMVESSAKVKPWREAVKAARWQIEQEGFLFGKGEPIVVRVDFYLARPQGHYGTGRNAAVLKPSAPPFPAGKPDVDKLLRSTLDGLKDAGCYVDDSQVVTVLGCKLYAKAEDPPGAGIWLSWAPIPGASA